MKGFWIGVASATLAGMLILIGTTQYQRWEAGRAQRIRYEANPWAKTVLTAELRAAVQAAEPGSTLHNVSIKNVGSDDLDNLELELQSNGLSAVRFAGFLNKTEDTSETPTVSKSASGYSVRYKLLRQGEGAQLWVVTTGIASPYLTSSRKGLSFAVVTSAKEDTDLTIPFLFTLGIAMGLSAVLGFVQARKRSLSVEGPKSE